MKRIKFTLLLAGLLLGATGQIAFAKTDTKQGASQRLVCPHKLSTISQNLLPKEVGSLLQQAYQDIGCTIIIEPVPGRRGIMHFNNAVSDGEVMRLSVVEPSYTRAFARTAQPLFEIQNAVWRRKNASKNDAQIYGFTLGIKWTEIHSQYDPENREYVPFSHQSDLLNALNSEKILGYLSSSQGITLRAEAGLLKFPMIMEQEISRLPVFHYVATEFRPALRALEVVISEKKIFEDLQPN